METKVEGERTYVRQINTEQEKETCSWSEH